MASSAAPVLPQPKTFCGWLRHSDWAEPVYLLPADTSSTPSPGSANVPAVLHRATIISLTAGAPHSVKVDRGRDAVRNHALKLQLQQLLAGYSAQDCTLVSSAAFEAQSASDYYEVGWSLIVKLPPPQFDALLAAVLQLAAQWEQDAICQYDFEESSTGVFVLRFIPVNTTSNYGKATGAERVRIQAVTVQGLVEAGSATPFPPPQVHFAHHNMFASLGDALQCLASARSSLVEDSNVRQVLGGDVASTLATAIDRVLLEATGNTNGTGVAAPDILLIALEGLDGTGKSTLARNLGQLAHFTADFTPGPQWCQIDGLGDVRQIFDRCGMADLRRAFYYVANVAAGRRIMASCGGDGGHDSSQGQRRVVVDRYAYSSMAYAAGAAAHTVEGLPAAEAKLWRWPADVRPAPTLVVFLQLSSAARIARIGQRASRQAVAETEEEKRLARSRRLEQAVETAFLRCCQHNSEQIPFIVLDADQPPEKLAEQVLQAVKLAPLGPLCKAEDT